MIELGGASSAQGLRCGPRLKALQVLTFSGICFWLFFAWESREKLKTRSRGLILPQDISHWTLKIRRKQLLTCMHAKGEKRFPAQSAGAGVCAKEARKAGRRPGNPRRKRMGWDGELHRPFGRARRRQSLSPSAPARCELLAERGLFGLQANGLSRRSTQQKSSHSPRRAPSGKIHRFATSCDPFEVVLAADRESPRKRHAPDLGLRFSNMSDLPIFSYISVIVSKPPQTQNAERARCAKPPGKMPVKPPGKTERPTIKLRCANISLAQPARKRPKRITPAGPPLRPTRRHLDGSSLRGLPHLRQGAI